MFYVSVMSIEIVHSLQNSHTQKNFAKVFNISNNPGGGFYLFRNDPSHICKLAKVAMERVNAVKFSISSGIPDCNPIENFFNLVERNLQTDAPEQNIQHEPYPGFVQRIKKTITEFPVETIDYIIGSMHNRMLKMVGKGIELHHSHWITLCNI